LIVRALASVAGTRLNCSGLTMENLPLNTFREATKNW